jgi:radical SAM protein with 4Fe4S-binding SPASM domain
MLPETFCVLPWINLSTDVNGSLRPCCKFAQPSIDNEYQLPNMKDGSLLELWNHEKFQNLRRAFLDGKKPTECSSCWNEEAAGLSSFRTEFVQNKKIRITGRQFGLVADSGPLSLDLKLNNVCNLKCRICGPQASSTFLKEHQERFNIKITDGNYWLSDKILGTENESVIKLWASELQHLEITGGEPMASPENIKILEILIASERAHEITILLNTNGTLYNKKFINLLTKFKHVTISLSIDDIGPRLEYQRYPTDWSTIQQNLEKFCQLRDLHPNICLTLCPTVSVFNVYYLPEYIKWANGLNIGRYYNVLHYHPCYSIKNLPETIKELVREKLTEPEFINIINFLNLNSEELIPEFIKQVTELDRHRHQSFTDVFGVWGVKIMEHHSEST